MAVLFNHMLDSGVSTLIFFIGLVITILLVIIVCCTNPPNPHRNGVYIVKSSKHIRHSHYHHRYLTQPIKTVSLNITCAPSISRDIKQNNIIVNGLSTTLPVSKSAKLDAIIQFTRDQEYDTKYNKSGIKVVSCDRSFL
ncbi:Hypothetical protein SRAE_1000064200 [Strongyloides ratti]|uniref:Uncharacterized protein n=1 Tax=Strongyloides ratti TaxID=34506 RepID=A0A090L4F9_STRRB|nr:Hypothetical protein SRAE_1000064200 [Strongyloides ratti]CEF62369.1 Hypothetical protein SRAE_1000064200 [Strongyloides ratti]